MEKEISVVPLIAKWEDFRRLHKGKDIYDSANWLLNEKQEQRETYRMEAGENLHFAELCYLHYKIKNGIVKCESAHGLRNKKTD